MCVVSNYMDLEEAVMIALDTKIYREYEEISRWMDRKKLYDFLVNNPVIRNSNTTFLAFYNSMQSDALHQLYEADIKLIDFLNAYTTNNATLIALKQAAAFNENNNIDNTRIQEKNEQVINAIYIKLLTEGLDNLIEDDINIISELANKCPYQEGSAVYKARTLNAIYNPTQMYDDIDICNTVGVYKTSNNTNSSNGIFSNENDYLKNLKPNYNNVVLSSNEITVYPNPTDNILNISYNIIDNASLIIQDLLGRKVIEINLSNKSNHAIIDVSKLTTGVYIYQLNSGKMILKSDKIIIE